MPSCPHCGNNPIPHRLNWFNETITALLSPVSELIFGSRGGKIFFGYAGKIFLPLGWLMQKVGVARYLSEPTAKTSARGRVLWEEAQRRGIVMEMLSVFGRENDSYRARVKGKTIHFSGLPRPEYMPKSAEWWIDDKSIVKEKLLQHGLPASVGGTYSNYHSLQRAFKQLQKPVILKPRLGSRGRHTTTHIHTEEQLKRAYAIAKQLCYWVVMEEHLFGSVFRATMIDAKLAGILRGDPPRITGDGIHTIAELITIKDSTRREGIKPVKISSETEHFIGRSGYTFESILPEGKNIELAHTIGVSYGGYSAEETHITHPEIVRLLELSAQVIGDPIIGFDFIIPDVSASPHTQRWGIIEANGVPFINLHHDPIDGTRNVAEKVWDFVEDNLQWY